MTNQGKYRGALTIARFTDSRGPSGIIIELDESPMSALAEGTDARAIRRETYRTECCPLRHAPNPAAQLSVRARTIPTPANCHKPNDRQTGPATAI